MVAAKVSIYLAIDLLGIIRDGFVYVGVRACERACVRACVRARVCICVCVCVRARARAFKSVFLKTV